MDRSEAMSNMFHRAIQFSVGDIGAPLDMGRVIEQIPFRPQRRNAKKESDGDGGKAQLHRLVTSMGLPQTLYVGPGMCQQGFKFS